MRAYVQRARRIKATLFPNKKDPSGETKISPEDVLLIPTQVNLTNYKQVQELHRKFAQEHLDYYKSIHADLLNIVPYEMPPASLLENASWHWWHVIIHYRGVPVGQYFYNPEHCQSAAAPYVQISGFYIITAHHTDVLEQIAYAKMIALTFAIFPQITHIRQDAPILDLRGRDAMYRAGLRTLSECMYLPKP